MRKREFGNTDGGRILHSISARQSVYLYDSSLCLVKADYRQVSSGRSQVSRKFSHQRLHRIRRRIIERTVRICIALLWFGGVSIYSEGGSENTGWGRFLDEVKNYHAFPVAILLCPVGFLKYLCERPCCCDGICRNHGAKDYSYIVNVQDVGKGRT